MNTAEGEEGRKPEVLVQYHGQKKKKKRHFDCMFIWVVCLGGKEAGRGETD